MADIIWTTETRKLSDLAPQEDNPRQIRKEQAQRLEQSWQDYGQVETMAVGPDGRIYNGHQRYYVLLASHGPEYEVDCRVASRPLTKREWQRLTVLLHEGAVGEWDFDTLANWDVDELVDWGFSQERLFGTGEWVPDFAPVGVDEQPRLDQKKPIVCPGCGHEFVPS